LNSCRAPVGQSVVVDNHASRIARACAGEKPIRAPQGLGLSVSCPQGKRPMGRRGDHQLRRDDHRESAPREPGAHTRMEREVRREPGDRDTTMVTYAICVNAT
jgi:hypothetical protein